MEYGFDRLFQHTVTLLFLYSRQFLFLKKHILIPDRRWVIGLNYRIAMLSIKCISIYALVMRSYGILRDCEMTVAVKHI